LKKLELSTISPIFQIFPISKQRMLHFF